MLFKTKMLSLVSMMLNFVTCVIIEIKTGPGVRVWGIRTNYRNPPPLVTGLNAL